MTTTMTKPAIAEINGPCAWQGAAMAGEGISGEEDAGFFGHDHALHHHRQQHLQRLQDVQLVIHLLQCQYQGAMLLPSCHNGQGC